MKDVARIAGVSLATVSRVLNDKGGTIPISKETRDRVLAVVDRVGYKPNYAAQRLRSQQLDHSIAVYVPWGWGIGGFGSFTGKLLESVSKSMRGMPYTVTIVFYELGDIRAHHEELQRVRAHRIDAMLIVGADHDDLDYLDTVSTDGNPPFVAVHRELVYGNFVTANNREGARAIVSHAAARGHRRIAVLSTPPVHGGRRDFIYQQRYDGYVDAVRAYGASVDERLTRFVEEDDPAAAGAAVRELCALDDPPTTIFAARDSLAVATIRTLRSLGIRVPEEMGVVAFSDNAEVSDIIDPPLTRVVVPVEQMGAIAVTRLMAMLKGENPEGPLQVSLDCQILQGESC
jgi:LacI family transcriptional regulator